MNAKKKTFYKNLSTENTYHQIYSFSFLNPAERFNPNSTALIEVIRRINNV